MEKPLEFIDIREIGKLTVVQYQHLVTSLSFVPFEPCGRSILKCLHNRNIVPSAALLSALLSEYLHVRKQNVILNLGGKKFRTFHTPHYPILKKLSALDSPVPEFVKYLNLSNTDFDDEMAPYVASLSNLEVLDLSRSAITDIGVASILRPSFYENDENSSALCCLRYLNLRGTKISDSSIYYLARSPALVGIDLTECNISKASRLETHGWLHVPLSIPLFDSRMDLHMTEDESLAISETFQDCDIQKIEEIITGAWQDSEVFNTHTEIWHYVMGIPLGTGLQPVKDEAPREFWTPTETYIFIRLQSGAKDAAIPSEQSDKDNLGMLAVRKRKCADEVTDFPASEAMLSNKTVLIGKPPPSKLAVEQRALCMPEIPFLALKASSRITPPVRRPLMSRRLPSGISRLANVKKK